MSVYLGRNKVGITKYEDLDTELTEQEELLNTLEEDVNALSDKSTDMLQARVDGDNSCQSLFVDYQGTELDISKLDTSNVTTMLKMFDNCRKLEIVDVSNFKTSNVTNMGYMFNYCSDLTNIDVSKFDTSNVTNMSNMFNGCAEVENLDVSNFKTSNVTSMESMFRDCKKLTNLDLSKWDTSNVISMNNMFTGCNKVQSIDVSNFNTSKVTNMNSFLGNCSDLTNIDVSKFDTSNIKNFNSVFYHCEKLPVIDMSSWDTSEGTVFQQMFRQCNALTTIVGTIDMISDTSTSTSSMFYNTKSLVDVTLKNIRISLTLGSDTTYGHLLSLDSLLNTIKELWDLTGSSSQTLKLSTTSKENIANIYVKLIDVTDEMRAEDEYIDNKKPCVVCESTDEGAMTLTEYAISKNWAIA